MVQYPTRARWMGRVPISCLWTSPVAESAEGKKAQTVGPHAGSRAAIIVHDNESDAG